MQVISVGTSPVTLAPAGNRDFLSIFNNDAAATLYLCFDGDVATLTAANGFPLPAQQSLHLNNVETKNTINRIVTAIAPAGTIDVRLQGV